MGYDKAPNGERMKADELVVMRAVRRPHREVRGRSRPFPFEM